MSECCDTGEGCITDFISGAGGVYGYNFIVQNRPFNASGDCCEILCSGFPDVSGARNFDLEYISIDDGQGGFIENISGRETNSTPSFNPLCCTPTPTTTFSTGCACETPQYSTTCVTTTTYCTPGGSCFTTTITTFCLCCSSGYAGQCLPFEWDSSSCKFTGRLFNNDGATSILAGIGEVYFNDCLNKWSLSTDWVGSANQWPDGQRLDADCTGCIGLCACQTGKHGDTFTEFLGGGGTGTVCCVRDLCGAVISGSRGWDELHGLWTECTE